jgi:hypothetical protein
MQKNEIKRKAALILVASGRATVGEAAALRKISRQAMQKAAREINPRRARRRYLRTVWKEVVNRLTG